MSYSKILILVLTSFLMSFSVSGQLYEGDLMFVGFNADGSDGFSVVAMTDIPSNTVIYFSDNEWNGLQPGFGGAFNNFSEGIITWNTGPFYLFAGEVITFRGIRNDLSSFYTVTRGSMTGTMNLQIANEVLYAYMGTSSLDPQIFLSAITNNWFNGSNGTLQGTNLNEYQNAIAIPGNQQILVYSGPTFCTPDIYGCSYDIASPFFWSTDGGQNNQAVDGIYPDFPIDVPYQFYAMGILPISLTSFEVNLHETNKAKIIWTTETETNNSHFTIEKSTDADSWVVVETISGAGNSLHSLSYEMVDETPFYGISYYRLKQTDFDGAFEYFPMESFRLDPQIQLAVYPNPTEKELQLTGSDIQDARLSIFNPIGQLMELKELQRATGKVTMDVSGLPSGMYFLSVVNRGQTKTLKFKKD